MPVSTSVFTGILFPIFFVVAIGWIVGRTFDLHRPTLAKLNTTVFVPALLFVKILESEIASAQFGMLVLFGVVHIALLLLIGFAVFSLPPLRSSRRLLVVAGTFSNIGNYGIPLTVLTFGPHMVGHLAVLLLVQNTLTFSIGHYLLSQHKQWQRQLSLALFNPVTLAAFCAFALRGLQVELPQPLSAPLKLLADGLVPVALITLGAEMAAGSVRAPIAPIAGVSLMRFVVAPVVASILAWAFAFPPDLSALVVVTAALPVAVNVYLLASQHDREATLATTLIIWTTLLSAIAVSFWIAVVR